MKPLDEYYGIMFTDDDDIPFCDCSGCCNWTNSLDEEKEMECEEMGFWCLPDVERIIFNPPATIVFWADKTKTVVKCMEGEKFERYAGFAMACMKKLFGSTSRGKAVMNVCDETKYPMEEKNNETSAE